MLGGPISGAIGMPVNSAPRTRGEAQSFEYSAPGNYTFTVPAGASAIDVVVIGGGGSGGGHNANTSGGPSGNAGGTSSFGSFCSATGGGGGSGAQFSNAASGGSGSGGDTNLAGGAGGQGDRDGRGGRDGGDGQGGAPGGGGGGRWQTSGGSGGSGGKYGGDGGDGKHSLAAGAGGAPGGGGGGIVFGGGGGGGGVAIERVKVSPGDAIPVVVGAGGASVTGSHPYASGAGADGAVRLSWVGEAYTPPKVKTALESAALRVPSTISLPGGNTHSRGALADCLRFPQGIKYIGTSDPFSVMFVFTAKYDLTISRGVVGEVYGYWGSKIENGNLILFTYTGKYNNILHAIKRDTTYAVIMTIGSSTFSAYVSGAPDRTLQGGIPQKYDTVGAIDVGAVDMAYGARQFHGDVHDFALWNKVLTSQEIESAKSDLSSIHGVTW